MPGKVSLPPLVHTLRRQWNSFNRRWQRTQDPSYKIARDELNEQVRREIVAETNRKFGYALQKMNFDCGCVICGRLQKL